MKKITILILMIVLYSFPFVYFSMQQDFETGSMIGYVMMVIFTSMIAFFSKLFIKNTVTIIIIGNLISAAVSYYFLNQITGDVDWESYFKPLSPVQLLLLVSSLNLIPQLIAIKIASIVKLKLAYIWN